MSKSILSADCIQLGTRATDKIDAIRKAGQLLVTAGCVAPEYVEGMLARERSMSTYLGSNVAIPHGEFDNRAHILRTAISVLQLEQPVEWEPGEPVRLVIGIAADSDEHIGVLQQLATAIENERILNELLSTREKAVILRHLADQQPFDIYTAARHTLPKNGLAWKMYGAGIASMGVDGRPESESIPTPATNQLLVRIDAVGLCFSDLKIIQQGGKHPKLYGRDLSREPTRLGHEVALTIMAVGEDLQDRYQNGQRCAVQPDIFHNGKSAAYGYTIPGGLTQYHLIGPEVLHTDGGPCLLPLNENMGYAESALLEPWGCVMAAYTQRRRLHPRKGGVMWILGNPGDSAEYKFSQELDAPARIVLTNAPDSIHKKAAATGAKLIEHKTTSPADFAALAAAETDGAGFDDVVIFDPRSADWVSAAAAQVARRGTLNLVGRTALDAPVNCDVGRLHYDYIAWVGTPGPDAAAAYGEQRNRCDLLADGVCVVLGAGGPMGQMHVQRALEHPRGPKVVIATDISPTRLTALRERFGPLAEQRNRRLLVVDGSATHAKALMQIVREHSHDKGADDAIVCVPSAQIMAEAAALLNAKGMLVLFAGVPNGTLAAIDISNVYLGNLQLTGTSGLTIHDQALVMENAVNGALSPERSVAAIGGMNAARDGIEALMAGRYPGKIVIWPQIDELPLTALEDLQHTLPDVAEKLAPGHVWTREAERALLSHGWHPPE